MQEVELGGLELTALGRVHDVTGHVTGGRVVLAITMQLVDAGASSHAHAKEISCHPLPTSAMASTVKCNVAGARSLDRTHTNVNHVTHSWLASALPWPMFGKCIATCMICTVTQSA